MTYKAKKHYQNKDVAENYYGKRFRSFKGRFDHFLEKSFLQRSLQSVKIKSALDVACGTGRMTKELLLLGIPSIVGSDISQEMLDNAKRYCKIDKYSPEFKQGDATNLPLEDKSFDLVISFRFLDHLPEDEKRKALSEMARVSKRYLLFSMANTNFWTNLTRVLRKLIKKDSYEGYLVTESDILKFLDEQKIKVLRQKLKMPLLSMETIYFCEV